MRMFLIGMCDIFLILYLTTITSVGPSAILTVDDFYTLKSMHETLKADKEKSEETLQDKLRQERKEKENLEAKLAGEKERLQDTEKLLLFSDAERERINRGLKEKEEMIKARERLLADLNEKIAAKEEARRKMEASYQQKIKSQQKATDESLRLAQQLKVEARDAQTLANQMQEEVTLAYKMAETATTVQKKALILKEEALKEKEVAERKAAEALAAKQKAEAQREKALQDMESAKADQKRAERSARMFAATVREIKQSGETAFEENIRPLLQTMSVTYERKIADGVTRYKRELKLLPVKIRKQIYVVFPSRQIGFSRRSDKAPYKLVITYQDKRIEHGWINKEDDLIAILLPGYEGGAHEPYAVDANIAGLMPTLLALRNNGNRSLLDKVRGLSDSYFIVNRDYLKPHKRGGLKYAVTGLPGTGTRAERIVSGDQLVDLNGRLIGVARDSNHIIRITSPSEWVAIGF